MIFHDGLMNISGLVLLIVRQAEAIAPTASAPDCALPTELDIPPQQGREALCPRE
jgi:hypothetical protein